ncbi:MAG: beta-Ala-His dipeptidase [Lagierella massiliensis]|nr:beta-Ala-His dipeptidase [Lagierella massiliensis]
MLEDLQPKDVLYWFEQINKIPRCSKHEKEISDYILDFAKERNLEAKRDELFNVIIKKPATKGLENGPTIILQGHMDMVCVKTENSDHDFSKDPINLKVINNWITAENTTLGADNGIAVAYCLALLDSKDIPHSNLEILLTTREELGLEGASIVKGEDLNGKYLLNIDGELEGNLLVGCAGAVTMTSKKKLEFEKAKLKSGYSLKISGLMGGHSGMQIENFRGNAIKFIPRLFHGIDNIEISHMESGLKRNAIPAYAVVKFNSDEESIKEITNRINTIVFEHRITDQHLTIHIDREDKFESVWSKSCQKDILDCLLTVPDGVLYMDPSFKGLVQTSISNDILRQKDDEISLVALLRSTVTSSLDEFRYKYEVIVNNHGFELSDDGGYPVWEYNPDSKLQKIATSVYNEMYNEQPNVHTVHCGLECGILKQILKNTDMISFGPTMHDVHTTKERVSIESIGKVWNFTKNLVTTLSKS